MKKICLGVLMVFGLMSNCFAQVIAENVRAGTDDTLAINVYGTNTVYTHSFRMDNAEELCTYRTATSDGTVNVTVRFEQSYDVPSTEGASDTAWSKIYKSTGDIQYGITGTAASIDTIEIAPMPYGRFVLTGVGSNSGTTKIRMKVGKRNE